MIGKTISITRSSKNSAKAAWAWSIKPRTPNCVPLSLKELWDASALPEPPSLTGDVVSVMMQKLKGARILSIDPSGTKADRVGRGDRESCLSIWALRIAAAVVLSLGIYGLQHWIHRNRPEPAIAFREFTTANAQKMQLRLSDGSLVYLNAASQLRVPTAFSRQSRQIYMQGEAFFKVTHGPSAFVVNTELGKIEDIGTEFNVRVRGHQLQVVVAEGEVALYPTVDEGTEPGLTESSADRTRLPVSAGQMAGLSKQGKFLNSLFARHEYIQDLKRKRVKNEIEAEYTTQ